MPPVIKIVRRPVRQAALERKTKETSIKVALAIDGTGNYAVDTGMGFLDHMLETFTKHGLFNLKIHAAGDLRVDFHHTVEDIGLVMGQAFKQALGDKAGITRFGSAVIPMDEALAECVVDLSGRPVLVYEVQFGASRSGAASDERIGDFPVSLVHEFFEAFSTSSETTLHLYLRRGQNAHHGIEALFKAAARALRLAASYDPRVSGVPSTKGVL
ncbi:MAG: imidazoleglycerol-phosphate dehydratase [Candidatus Lindowbacteria bacterium RIFCSPLOWO2_12_FULL_62_27]|nr:MAG: imidazoleglycerol-phosphate dehydratase [Candidatus Lindowbacteria bacterium RIFCSPLOWO2_12_FULL_62_27]OGH57921.1 MAG: imidazoleglycerol-phosphate dehydratase [Candidatus Lindowbacteria bacterium RIFCSPLOWO2_02_FULL_62_12]